MIIPIKQPPQTMSQTTPNELQLIDFSGETGQRTRKWDQICSEVRKACEEYGFFQVKYDEISPQLIKQTFEIARGMFKLPVEVKKQNKNPKPYHSYYCGHLYESFGVEDASNPHSLTCFEKLLWADDHNPANYFLETMNSVLRKLDELHYAILSAVVDSYGLREDDDDSKTDVAQCKTLMRIMKYKAPPPGSTDMDGLGAHTDKPLCVILFADQSSGLDVQTKNGQWVSLSQSPNSFVFMVGDPLMAWSNGRLHAARHRVRTRGEHERYSVGTFLVPVEGTVIKPSKQLVDEEHPRLFKDFDYSEFLNFSFANMSIDSDKQLSTFAAIK